MKPRTDRETVLDYARQLGLEVCPPKKGAPGILITDYSRKPWRHVADAATWKEARAQLVEFARAVRP